MPEYLAPGVSVEEVDRGSKTIEGGSTSTAAMVGVTERGPVNVPIFLTSFADYRRWFGGHLNPETTDRWHLPSAVEGFFANGGKRLFVTRVVADPEKETKAFSGVFSSQGMETVLLASPLKNVDPKTKNFFLPIGNKVEDSVELLKIGIEGAVISKKIVSSGTPTSPFVMLLRESLTGKETDPKLIEKETELEVEADVASGNTEIIIKVVPSPDPKQGDYVITNNQILSVNSWDAPSREITLTSPVTKKLAKDEKITLLTVNTTAKHQSDRSAGMKAICFNVDTAASVGVVFTTPSDSNGFKYIQKSKYYQCDLGQKAVGLRTVECWVTPNTSTASSIQGSGGVLDTGNTALAIDDSLLLKTDNSMQVVQVSNVENGTATVKPAIKATGPFEVFKVEKAKGRVVGILPGQAGSVYVDYDGSDSPTHFTLPLEDGDAFAASPVTLQVVEVEAEDTDVDLSNFSAGTVVQPGQRLFTVKALDSGQWGNRLRVRTELPELPLVKAKVISGGSGSYRLDSTNGVEVGTWLRRKGVSPSDKDVVVKVTKVQKTQISVEPDPSWLGNETIESLEFSLLVQLLSDDAGGGKPSVLASEVFSGLSLAKEHSRFVQKVVGAVEHENDPTKDELENLLRRSDRRTMGESQLVRIKSEGKDPPLGLPDGPIEDQVTGRKVAVWKRLSGGKTGTVTSKDIVGTDDLEPAKRTGLYTLRNEDDISLVSCPGWTDLAVQQPLIEHCEQMKYRFAVLDAEGPGKDDLGSIKDQRSRYDSKYAAIYHPWVLISNPFQGSSGKGELACPPSGHVMGLIAEVDVRRGVHKAPANELLRGVVGLQRKLQKAEQELLNPFPSNLNVIRDFRSENRGIRVWGARVITSDPDWKYINVRRLFNFVEKSIERGMQWVVFEPNDEPLWARVRQSIGGFLKTVWRDGALQGRTPEEAFFVVADRTTMTQDDINNGRLIVEVGIAPVKPAEFVIIRIGMYTANAEN